MSIPLGVERSYYFAMVTTTVRCSPFLPPTQLIPSHQIISGFTYWALVKIWPQPNCVSGPYREPLVNNEGGSSAASGVENEELEKEKELQMGAHVVAV